MVFRKRKVKAETKMAAEDHGCTGKRLAGTLKWGQCSLTEIVLVIVLVVAAGICFYRTGGTTVVIKALDSSVGDVIFRGVNVDGTFYHGSLLVTDRGNWERDSYLCTSTDDTPLEIRVPYGKERAIVFNIGPERGQAEVKTKNDDLTLDLWREDQPDFDQQAFEIKGENGYLSTACAVVCTLVLLVFLLILRRRFYRYIPWKTVEYLFLACLIPLVFAVLYHLSFSSTPKIPEKMGIYGWDAAIYHLVGKGWLDGYVPYRDLFEQKGPLTFFVYTIGELINSQWGIFLLQITSLWISTVFAYRIAKLFVSIPKAMISAVVTLTFYVLVMDEGAIVEDFNLPVLMISTYLIVKYLKHVDENVEHPPKYAFVYGIACAVSLYMRVTNCVAICCFVAYITILLICKKKYSNLLKNIVGFVLGGCVVILPLVIYFASQGALDDMLEMYLYQLHYTNTAVNASGKTLGELKTILTYLSPVIVCALFALEKKNFRIPVILCAAVIVYMMKDLYLFPHYYIIYVVFVPIAVSWFFEDTTRLNAIPVRYSFSFCAISVSFALYILLQIGTFASGRYTWIEEMHNSKEPSEHVQKYEELFQLVPSEDRDKIVAYNINCDWWLINDAYPCQRQVFSTKVAFDWWPEMRQECLEFYRSPEARWVVVEGELEEGEMSEIFSTDYILYKSLYIDEYGEALSLYKKIQ